MEYIEHSSFVEIYGLELAHFIITIFKRTPHPNTL